VFSKAAGTFEALYIVPRHAELWMNVIFCLLWWSKEAYQEIVQWYILMSRTIDLKRLRCSLVSMVLVIGFNL
jgi:hypothetical protein